VVTVCSTERRVGITLGTFSAVTRTTDECEVIRFVEAVEGPEKPQANYDASWSTDPGLAVLASAAVAG
jgi:hypothetical protein